MDSLKPKSGVSMGPQPSAVENNLPFYVIKPYLYLADKL
jgi:hypothetical protein